MQSAISSLPQNTVKVKNPLVSLQGLKGLIVAFPIFTYIISFIKDWIISIMKTGPVPKHIALIMDGNRTFARKHNLTLKEGHIAGAESLVHVLDTSYRLGVSHVTIYAFSIENFNRSKEEVDTLFALLKERLNFLSENENSYARYNKIVVKVIGNRSMIPKDILSDLENIEAKTAHNSSNRTLNVCFPYTSRDDIANAIKGIAEQKVNSELQGELSQQLLVDNMYYGPDTPPLDIMIRTSGQTRLSDFMIWQCNYDCTIEFVDILWPEFKFFGIIIVLLKWGYYKTLEIEKNKLNGKLFDKKTQSRNIYKELPPHPPHKSVTER